jgi:hypothetical protein
VSFALVKLDYSFSSHLYSCQFLSIRSVDTNQTRVVKKVVPTDSFFTFFSPPSPPSEDDDLPEDEQEDIEQRLELDYQIGEDLKDRVRGSALNLALLMLELIHILINCSFRSSRVPSTSSRVRLCVTRMALVKISQVTTMMMTTMTMTMV